MTLYQLRMIHSRSWCADHSIMMNAMWRHFDHLAKQIIVGHTTMKIIRLPVPDMAAHPAWISVLTTELKWSKSLRLYESSSITYSCISSNRIFIHSLTLSQNYQQTCIYTAILYVAYSVHHRNECIFVTSYACANKMNPHMAFRQSYSSHKLWGTKWKFFNPKSERNWQK